MLHQRGRKLVAELGINKWRTSWPNRGTSRLGRATTASEASDCATSEHGVRQGTPGPIGSWQALGGPSFPHPLGPCRTVAIVGTAWSTKRAAAKAAAAAAALARLDTAAALPSREESGSHGAVVTELRRLQKLQPFKVWALEGLQPNDRLRFFCALWGQVPFQGGPRRV